MRRWPWQIGPREAAAQAVLDEMPDDEYRALGRDEAERLSNEVWAARDQDREDRERA